MTQMKGLDTMIGGDEQVLRTSQSAKDPGRLCEWVSYLMEYNMGTCD